MAANRRFDSFLTVLPGVEAADDGYVLVGARGGDRHGVGADAAVVLQGVGGAADGEGLKVKPEGADI